VLPDPVFHLSEGQRKHAILQGELFRLVVVHAISVGAKTHLVTTAVALTWSGQHTSSRPPGAESCSRSELQPLASLP
jgi:hypothetical protein